MTIFFYEQKFFKRLWVYSKFQLISILTVYLIFSLTSETFNPVDFMASFKIIFGLFIVYIIIPCFYRTVNYIQQIDFDKNRQLFTLSICRYNKIKIVSVNKFDLNLELLTVDILSRNFNKCLCVNKNDKCIVKQFDYFPWTIKKMTETITMVSEIKMTND